MSRIIRFRAWHKTAEKMYYPGEQGSPDITASGCPVGPHTRQNLSMDIELEQFTGLLDKNGKEIYEGDIVRYNRTCRVGTQRKRHGRLYESFAINEGKQIIGIVNIGLFKGTWGTIQCAYVKTDFSTEYDSYFWGDGKRTDVPTKQKDNKSEALKENGDYEIIGNIHSTPELLK